jgi:Tfp pilus assembly protein PilF
MFFRPFLLASAALSLLLLAPLRAQTEAPSGAAAASPTPVTAAPISPQSSTPELTSPAAEAQRKIADAIQSANANNMDGALHDLTEAIALNPNSTGAYVLRASIYTQRKMWPEAQADFNAAARLAPKNVVLKFNLVEMKFMQKQYDAARPGFVALSNDPDMGDFAQYKVFLCDLYGGHMDEAKKELDVFNDAMGNPSYYFANAAWDLYYKKIDDARSWLLSASRIYPAAKFTMYGQTLRDLGYLPIPEPKDSLGQ